MKVRISDHFTYGRLLRFTLPTIAMVIFTSLYGVVDGLFVSNFVGKTPFAAVNLIMPFIMGMSAVGFMLGTGGSAIVSKALGEGSRDRADRYFSMVVYVGIIGGVIMTVLGWIFARPISILLGADDEMLEYCVLYSRIILLAITPYVLQNVFQSLLITAGKPQIGFGLTVAAGVANMVLDLLFVGVLKWGVAGAAIATDIGILIGGVVPFIYFLRKNDSSLRLTKTRFERKIIIKTMTNGSSEMLSNLSMAVVNMLYNFQLMRLAGEDGVAAYGVIMYVNFIFTSVYFGYALGSAPIIGFNYGAQNHSELKNIFRKSMVLYAIWSIALTALAIAFSGVCARVFVGYDAELLSMTIKAFKIYSLSFLFMGFNIFGSSMFTALNNGAVSAAISFLRTLVFQVLPVLTLPILMGLDGIWFSVVAAELMSIAVTMAFIVKNRKKYNYV